MTNVFLGYPPERTRKWIEEHYSDKPEKYMGPLCFTAQEDNATVGMVGPYNWKTDTSDVTVSLQTSTDGVNWNTYEEHGWDGRIITLNEGEKLYVKALNPNTNGFYDQNLHSYHKFIIQEGKVAASGNIQYLLVPIGERMDVPNNCYLYMFEDCISLTQAPELPATSLAESCYECMFSGCTSLTQAPELPATTLAESCYSSMFENCISLTQAPELPATSLADYCYSYMFWDCDLLSEVHMKSDCSYDPDNNGRFNDSDGSGIDRITVVYDL